MKKILFFGTPDIAVPALEALVHDPNIEIVGVGVFPDRVVGRKQVLTPGPVKSKALELNLPILEIPNKEALINVFKTTDFDLALVIAFGMIFPAEILIDRRCVNIHFSKLPNYRGASPVQQAILDGKTETSITWQVMVYALDAGDVLFQKSYDITNMSTAQVWHDFAIKTAEALPEFCEAYFNDQLNPQPQNKSEATFCGKFTKADGLVNPQTENAETIYRKYLAFNPWPEIFMTTPKGNVKLKEISKTEIPESYELQCQSDSLWVTKAQIPGKPVMPISEILKGNPGLLDPPVL